MCGKVFIEGHLNHYLKSLAKEKCYIPGVIIGQVVGENYYIVHLSAITTSREDPKDKTQVLAYNLLTDLLDSSDTIFKRLLEVVNLLPGGSHVLGLFCIVPQDLKNNQPINMDFHKFIKQLNEHLLFTKNKTWNYLLLNYSSVNKKLFCYTVDFNHLNGKEKIKYKPIDEVFGSFDNDWVNLVGYFNFGTMDQLNVGGGSKALFSIRENLLNTFESVLNELVYTFNGYICDENKTFKDFECDTIGDLLKNVINIEFYKKVDLGNDYKNASLKVERGKRKVLMTGLCSLVVPFNRNGTIKDAIKAIQEDGMRTFETRLKMHLDSLVEEESIQEEDASVNVEHEIPRRVLILKTEGFRFVFSDYVFPGEPPQEALSVAGEILNLSNEKIELYDELEKGRHSYYETLPDISSSSSEDVCCVTSNNILNKHMLVYFTFSAIILAILAHFIKPFIV